MITPILTVCWALAADGGEQHRGEAGKSGHCASHGIPPEVSVSALVLPPFIPRLVAAPQWSRAAAAICVRRLACCQCRPGIRHAATWRLGRLWPRLIRAFDRVLDVLDLVERHVLRLAADLLDLADVDGLHHVAGLADRSTSGRAGCPTSGPWRRRSASRRRSCRRSSSAPRR